MLPPDAVMHFAISGIAQGCAYGLIALDFVLIYKASETDFVGSIAAIKNSGCEMLVLGPLVKDTILIYTAARDAGWDAPIISNMVSYVPEVASSANGATDGLYAAASCDQGARNLCRYWAGGISYQDLKAVVNELMLE